jgi:hypothetical protein
MRNTRITSTSARRLRVGIAAAASALAVCVLPAAALGATANDTTQFQVNAGSLLFGTAPDVPNLNGVTLNGQAQTTTSSMNSYSVADATGSGSGWNVTVAGDGPSGSAVFKQYCNSGTACNGGADAANSYVSGGAVLPANSLTLSSSGGTISPLNGSTGTGPTHQCSSGCFVDAGSATKVLSAASGAGMGTFQAGYAAGTLSLATPSSLHTLPTNEIYKVNLLWSLNSGP